MAALPAIARVRTVSAYVARPEEIPIDAVVRALWRRGVRVVLPRVCGADLRLHEVSASTALVQGSLGVREPPADAPGVEPGIVDLFLVPGLLFDRRGRRLGRGGGHFDRLLARARESATRVGLCHAARLWTGLPEDPWDVRMHVVITTSELIDVFGSPVG